MKYNNEINPDLFETPEGHTSWHKIFDIPNSDLIIWINREPFTVPHFHIKSESNNFDCAIYLYEDKYFDHISTNNKLNHDQIIILNNFLNSYPKLEDWRDLYTMKATPIKLTAWEELVWWWDNINNDNTIELKFNQPDYHLII